LPYSDLKIDVELAFQIKISHKSGEKRKKKEFRVRVTLDLKHDVNHRFWESFDMVFNIRTDGRQTPKEKINS